MNSTTQSRIIKLKRLPKYVILALWYRQYRLELVHYWYCGAFSNFNH